jgi:hypothetical protein
MVKVDDMRRKPKWAPQIVLRIRVWPQPVSTTRGTAVTISRPLQGDALNTDQRAVLSRSPPIPRTDRLEPRLLRVTELSALRMRLHERAAAF